MEKFLILPAIDIRGGKCVRLLQGDYDRETVYSDSPVSQAVKWQSEGAEFLHLVDLDGAKQGFPVNLESIREISKSLRIPCELGGGIRSIEAAKSALDAGVSRIIIGTAACGDTGILTRMIKEFGAGRIVVGLDARDGKLAVKGWIENTDIMALDFAEKLTGLGITRFIYTDISTDGMLSGPNIPAISELCRRIPSAKIIASGGISSEKDILDLISLKIENLEGAITGKALYDGRIRLHELLQKLRNQELN